MIYFFFLIELCFIARKTYTFCYNWFFFIHLLVTKKKNVFFPRFISNDWKFNLIYKNRNKKRVQTHQIHIYGNDKLIHTYAYWFWYQHIIIYYWNSYFWINKIGEHILRDLFSCPSILCSFAGGSSAISASSKVSLEFIRRKKLLHFGSSLWKVTAGKKEKEPLRLFLSFCSYLFHNITFNAHL